MADSWVIGSAEDCDVVVPHPNVSGHHCRLTRTRVGWSLEDLKSRNGTFVNRQRIAEPTAVSQHDTIMLGKHVQMPWPDLGKAQETRRSESTKADQPDSGSAQATPSRKSTKSDQPASVSPEVTPRRESAEADRPVFVAPEETLPNKTTKSDQPYVVLPEETLRSESDFVAPEETLRSETAELARPDAVSPEETLHSESAFASPEETLRSETKPDQPCVVLPEETLRTEFADTNEPDPVSAEETLRIESPPADEPRRVQASQNSVSKPAPPPANPPVAAPPPANSPAHAPPPAAPPAPEPPPGAPKLRSAEVSVSMRGTAMIVGRDPACDEVLDYPMVSWRHAKIERNGASLTVEDLGSSNGTFVNGKRIRQRTPVKSGDVIGLGSYRFALAADGKFRRRDYRGDLTLEAQGIGVDIPGRRLVDQVSLTIYPSEFVGLMGPSGAGKSTLMNVLNGYSPPSDGQVTINGRNLYQHFGEFRGMIGFVPQDDIIHADLTVREALFYSARLRLPADFSNRDIHKRISDVLAQLGLVGLDDVLVGSPNRRGISGGQRKRVNLAMELLTDPSLLFLDEPTSGLSSEDTLIVMRVLRELANSGKSILLTIHQPSLEAFQLLDNVVVIAKDTNRTASGRLVYYGPAHPDSVHFFNPKSQPTTEPLAPDALLRGLATNPVDSWVDRFHRSKFHREFVADRAKNAPSKSTVRLSSRAKHQRGLTQWWTLVRRALSIKRRDLANSVILLAQAPIIAALLVMVFGTKTALEMTAENWASEATATSITLFLMALSAIWFGCSNSVREVVSEWPIYVRERMVHLRIPLYFASKFTVLGGLCLIQCLILIGIVHWGAGLHGPWWPMFGLLLLASGVGLAIGLCISATVKTSEVAIALLPLVLLPMVILGGILQPQHEMHKVARWCSNAMPSRWAFEGLMLLEAPHRPKCLDVVPDVTASTPVAPSFPTPGAPVVPHVPISVDIAEAYFPEETDRMGVRASVLALGAMLIVLLLAIQTVLRFRDVH